MDALGRPPQFFGYRSQIFRAISNLLDNGLKHTYSGATVVIECSDTVDEFSVSIADDGPGLEGIGKGKRRSIDSLPVVVKHRASASAIFTPGTGLRFVSEVITAHNGFPTVERSSQGGSKFVLTFPKQGLD